MHQSPKIITGYHKDPATRVNRTSNLTDFVGVGTEVFGTDEQFTFAARIHGARGRTGAFSLRGFEGLKKVYDVKGGDTFKTYAYVNFNIPSDDGCIVWYTFKKDWYKPGMYTGSFSVGKTEVGGATIFIADPSEKDSVKPLPKLEDWLSGKDKRIPVIIKTK